MPKSIVILLVVRVLYADHSSMSSQLANQPDPATGKEVFQQIAPRPLVRSETHFPKQKHWLVGCYTISRALFMRVWHAGGFSKSGSMGVMKAFAAEVGTVLVLTSRYHSI
jgi:hypothetical protein